MPSPHDRFIPGGHTLSSAFIINDRAKLREIMSTIVNNGGKLIEIPYLLVELAWEEVARIAKETGIEEISLCHFWPKNPDGSSPQGDPLGDSQEVQRALITISNIINAILTIRLCGIRVRFIDGPLHCGLGWEYTNLEPRERFDRAVHFLSKAGVMCAASDIALAVEFLRPVEDKTVGGTRNMLEILRTVGQENVRMHFDVFHSLECGENPAESIRIAKHWITYLHLHGSKRLAPELPGDVCDWSAIIQSVLTINPSFIGSIPVVSEPFGEDTCRENPALGEGLPPALPLDPYLKQAFGVFKRHGLAFA